MAWKNLLSSMLFFLLSSLDFDLGRSKQPFYEAEGCKDDLSPPLSLSHSHNHPISFYISLQLIFMGIILYLTIVWI